MLPKNALTRMERKTRFAPSVTTKIGAVSRASE
jgi:hypothetical protein